MEINIDNLNSILTESAKELDVAACMIRDLDINKTSNVKRIGEALVNISEIQLELYKIKPDLKPDYLNDT